MTTVKSELIRLKDVYRGLAPTPAAKRAEHGELEVTVSEEGILFRHATGKEIEEFLTPTQNLRLATPEEIEKEFMKEGEFSGRETAFHGPIFDYLFLPKKGEEPDLLVLTRLREIKPTYEEGVLTHPGHPKERVPCGKAFSSGRVEEGLFQKYIETLDTEYVWGFRYVKFEGGLRIPPGYQE